MNRYKIGYCVGCGIHLAFIVFCMLVLILIMNGAAYRFNDQFISEVVDNWWAFPLVCIGMGFLGAITHGPIHWEYMQEKQHK